MVKFEQSGLTRPSFCRQHGFSPATVHNYRKRHSCGAGEKRAFGSSTASAIPFVPVELVAPPHRRETGNGASIFVELACGSRIAVTAGFDAATLTRLLAVLEQA